MTTTSSIWSQTNGEVLVVYFADAKILDDARIQQIGKDLTEMVTKAEHQKMLLNFQNVGFMSSAMIGKLILLSKKCKADAVLTIADETLTLPANEAKLTVLRVRLRVFGPRPQPEANPASALPERDFFTVSAAEKPITPFGKRPSRSKWSGRWI